MFLRDETRLDLYRTFRVVGLEDDDQKLTSNLGKLQASFSVDEGVFHHKTEFKHLEASMFSRRRQTFSSRARGDKPGYV